MSEPTEARQEALRDSSDSSPAETANSAEGEPTTPLSLRARIVRTALRRPKTLEQAVSFAHLLGEPPV